MEEIKDTITEQRKMMELLSGGGKQMGQGLSININQTISSNSPLYKEGNEMLNRERRGEEMSDDFAEMTVFNGSAIPVTRG